MAAEKVEATNGNVSRLIQRQLMLLDFQEQENEWGLRTWPTVPGISVDESTRLFAILERWGWIAGSPFPSDNFKCIVTSQGVERLTKIKAGQSLMGATDLTFVDDEHEILCKAALRPRFADGEAHKRNIVSRISHYLTSRPGLWVMLFMGIVLMMIGIHLSISEGITTKILGDTVRYFGGHSRRRQFTCWFSKHRTTLHSIELVAGRHSPAAIHPNCMVAIQRHARTLVCCLLIGRRHISRDSATWSYPQAITRFR